MVYSTFEYDWNLLLKARIGKKRASGLSIHCPFHDDRTASAVIFPQGFFYCTVCEVYSRVPIDIFKQIWGSAPTQEGSHSVGPTIEVVRQQTAIAMAAIKDTAARKRFAYQAIRFAKAKKFASADIIINSTIPSAQGLITPSFAWPVLPKYTFDPMDAPFINNESPLPVWITGMQYRLKDVLDDYGETEGKAPLKTLTFGFRGLSMPGKKYRPSWAWGGEVHCDTRAVVLCEAPQHALKMAEVTKGKVLCLSGFGAGFSQWQFDAIKALNPELFMIILDPDRVPSFSKINEIEYPHLYLDLDLIHTHRLHRVLEEVSCTYPVYRNTLLEVISFENHPL